MYNNKHNTRTSGRFNTPGQFVAAGEQEQSYPSTPQQPQQQPLKQKKNKKQQQAEVQEEPLQNTDVEMKVEKSEEDESNVSSKNEDRPSWMKSKLSGVKKISNKERRRRQNETLRRLLTPKNALMVLNEMVPHEQVASQFRVDAAQNQFYSRAPHSFCADLTLEGHNYKGYGDNKLSARNAAAEQAIRDLIIKKMHKVLTADTSSQNGSEEEKATEEETLPMIQLASFALHKLFAEWEYEGHKVPHMKPNPNSLGSETASMADNSPSVDAEAEAAAKAEAKAAAKAAAKVAAKAAAKAAGAAGGGASKPRTLPLNASSMHPSMLLSYMRPGLEYRELAVEGDKPQTMLFTMGVDIDGATYIGKASSKKEARRNAARAACQALFNLKF